MTIHDLIAEASRYHAAAKRDFEEHDNADDMNEMHRWELTVAWLRSKVQTTPATRGCVCAGNCFC